ncbi:hypothetical protein Sulku_2580 (plasmid) [Sulfuricurvum kujiense DSM 16994]|uniref:Uncharacterized protein n=1 Tax=Sulfuricurvum kujiense (strain ATCC BAA-921 / DSM 16994 / JCM 11577 / YK-1) TaxID=709032 RepID=E4U3H1_SULKY|nr:hypothetical protein [Sulfuricurvum kujiense]ADR35237.1 hypothetical protein Sulku_2580 [Sulfuricurvum kujiense DSM 16994]
MAALHEFNEEVIEALCELGGLSEAEAQSFAASKRSEIEYAHKYRLSPSIIAGSILGINDCCIPSQCPKS